MDRRHEAALVRVRDDVLIESDKLPGLIVWQWPQQHGVHGAEHGGGRAESDGEGEDGDGGEGGRAPEHAYAEGDVGDEMLEPLGAEGLTDVFLRAIDAAEGDAAGAARVVGCGARADARLLLHLEMERQLVIQFALVAAAREQVAKLLEQIVNAHAPAGSARASRI